MPLYATVYDLPNGRSAMTQCYARGPDHLAETIEARGMGELTSPHDRAVPAPVMASEHLRMGKVKEAIHAAAWVAMVAVRAKTADPWTLLCDTGPIHELSHYLIAGETFSGAMGPGRLVAELEALERNTPGVHPSWGGEAQYVAAVEDPFLADARRHQQAALSSALEAFQRETRQRLLSEAERQLRYLPVTLFPTKGY